MNYFGPKFCRIDNQEKEEFIMSDDMKAGQHWNSHFADGSQVYLPFDKNRVVLKDFPIDFVNASWLRIKNSSHNFIIAQTPIQSTVQNFWAMIAENKISLIIMMTNLNEEKGLLNQKKISIQSLNV